MASFDPQVQLPWEQNYLNWAKETREPLPDKSKGIALTTAAEGIEGAATIADRAVKENIASDVHNKVDNAQAEFTQALQSVHQPNQPTTNNPMDAMDLMPDKGTQPPAPVNNQLSRIQSIQSAYTGNKISETSYYQNLNTILKDVRSQYPGYRDYVDSEVQKITGVNPANAYMSSMIRDVNEQRTKAAAEQSYYEKALVNSGFTGSQEMLAGLRSGNKNISQVQQYLAANNERSEALKEQAAAFVLSDKSRSDYQAKAEGVAQAAATHAATDAFFNSNFVRSDPDSKTASQISDFINDMIAHPEKRAQYQDQIRNYSLQLEQMRAKNYAETQAYLSSIKTQSKNPDTGQPQSVVEALGPTRIKAIMDSTIGGLYDAQLTALKDQDVGLLHAIQNTTADHVNNAAYKLADGTSDLSKMILTFGAIGKLAPQMSPDLQSVVGGAYKGTSGDIGTDLYNFATHLTRQGVAQTGGSAPNGAYTFKQSQDEVSKAADVVKASNTDIANSSNKLLSLSKALTEKDPTIVDNAITYFYDSVNKGNLNKYIDDYYDPNRGWIINGRTSAFSLLTSADKTRSIYKRSKEGNDTAWDRYKDWAVNEAASNLQNIAKTWNENVELNKQDRSTHFSLGNPLGKTPIIDHQFYWNNETHQLGLMDDKGHVIQPTAWRLNQGLFQFRNANKYFESLANIAKQEGTDPNAFIFSTLRQAWPLDPESQKIFRAIVTSNLKPEKKIANEP